MPSHPSTARWVVLLVLALVAACVEAPAQAPAEATVVYVVRHAERAEDGTSDPPLSPEGRARAELVARMLSDAGITAVHSTDYIRTRQTARTVADALELETQIYDGRDPMRLLNAIRGSGGRHLVVAHSNTTPELVEALGGDGGEPIHEMEYDRLYILAIDPGRTTTILLRFGAPFEP